MLLNQAWSLLLVSVGAALLPSMARLIRIPAIVLEILFGVLLGQSVLQLEFTGDWLSFLARLGFLLLMFHAGMEIDFAMLRKQSVRQRLLQLTLFVSTFALTVMAAFLLGHGIFVALILSTTSLGLVVPTLRETGLTKSSLGQSILLAATLADFLTLLGITFYALWHEHGPHWHFLAPIPLFLGFGLILKLLKLWAWWHPQAAARLLSSDSQEMGVRWSLALLFLFVALSELAGLEPVLGAFMGGVVLSFVFRDKGQLETKLSGIGYGFLVPFFFIHVGMQFNLANVLSPHALLFTLKLLIAAVAVKILPSFLFWFDRISVPQAIKAGILLSSRLSLIIVAASIGLELGFIDAPMKDAIVLLAVVTCLLGPTAFKLLYKPEAPVREAGEGWTGDGTAGWMRRNGK
jgi:Kef-type K+ transport system membrane component KefB